MVRHLVQLVEHEFVVSLVYGAVIVVCMCAREVQITLVFNMDYSDWSICDLTNTLLIWKVYIDFAESGYSNVKRCPGLTFMTLFGSHACMRFGQKFIGIHLY